MCITDREHKMLENRLRREAKRKGFLLRRNHTRDKSAEAYGLYVLIGDSMGNRLPGAAAAPNAFLRGEGDTLEGIAQELATAAGDSPGPASGVYQSSSASVPPSSFTTHGFAVTTAIAGRLVVTQEFALSLH